ncbi:MAG: hypothetical protein ACI8WB_006016 [Phenylobacterium sp.]
MIESSIIFKGVIRVSGLKVVKADEATVLSKAFNNACQALSVSNAQAGRILGVNPSTLARNVDKGFSPKSKTGELQLHFIRLYRSLFAIAGGDMTFMNHWFMTDNTALAGVPAQLCERIDGLLRINDYLDAMRGKI